MNWLWYLAIFAGGGIVGAGAIYLAIVITFARRFNR